jgi:hypothetical protein
MLALRQTDSRFTLAINSLFLNSPLTIVTLPWSSSSVHRIFSSFAARVIRPKLSKPIGIGASPMTSLRGGGGGSERDSRGCLRPKSSHALVELVDEKARRCKAAVCECIDTLRLKRCGANKAVSDLIAPASKGAPCCGASPLQDATLPVPVFLPLAPVPALPAMLPVAYPHLCPLKVAQGALVGSRACLRNSAPKAKGLRIYEAASAS